MTAKPAQQPAPPAGLVDSLQAEVAAEASPLMLFLVEHARKIALALVLFILAIGGYWFYASHTHKVAVEDAQRLGTILIISDPAMRLERLEAFIPSAPSSVKHEAWFALANAAGQVQDYPKAYKAWETIRGFDPALKGAASLGMANALAQQGKYADALSLLNAALPDLKGPEAINANMRIILLAEVLGDYARAIAACDAILTTPEAAADVSAMNRFGQKKAELEAKLSALKK
ncbi:MAG: tetratricopeptide repeat protein [Desulfovibrionaceae bacterium]|nr:tetratricopeptide repeat protein [Desulfovibrionaceae bacterium]